MGMYIIIEKSEVVRNFMWFLEDQEHISEALAESLKPRVIQIVNDMGDKGSDSLIPDSLGSVFIHILQELNESNPLSIEVLFKV